MVKTLILRLVCICAALLSPKKEQGLMSGDRLVDEVSQWWEMARVIDEANPAFIVVENPDGLRHRGLLDILRYLAKRGYDAEWQTISVARISGAPHWRERIFIVAYSHHLSSRLQGATSWAEQLGSGADVWQTPNSGSGGTGQKGTGGGYFAHSDRQLVAPRPEDEFGWRPVSDAVPPWLGGIASDEWCKIWLPPQSPGRPKTSNSPDFPLESSLTGY